MSAVEEQTSLRNGSIEEGIQRKLEKYSEDSATNESLQKNQEFARNDKAISALKGNIHEPSIEITKLYRQ